jgi:regulatory protein
VSADLMKSGVGRELAFRAVAEEFEGRSELADARSAAARRYNGQGSEAEARRVYGFLARRGYSAGVCAEVAKEHRGTAQS